MVCARLSAFDSCPVCANTVRHILFCWANIYGWLNLVRMLPQTRRVNKNKVQWGWDMEGGQGETQEGAGVEGDSV